VIGTLSEFKTNYDFLSIVTHAVRIGGGLEAYYNPIYGGYVGGAEGVALAIVAGLILLNQVDMAHIYSTRPNHPFYNCDTTPELIWATSLLGADATSNLMVAADRSGGWSWNQDNHRECRLANAMTVSDNPNEASHSAAGGRIARHASGLMPNLWRSCSCRAGEAEQANELVTIDPTYWLTCPTTLWETF
jgi:hypothetical protein